MLTARLRRALGPLVRASTYRRGVFLLLGAVVLLPYVLLGAAFVQMLTGDEVPRLPVVVLLALTAGIAVAPAFLRSTRALEIHAVRGLLDVDLPEPPPVGRTARSLESAWIGWQTRLATSTWYAFHLAAGGLLAVVLFAVLPVTIVYLLVRLRLASDSIVSSADLGPLGDLGPTWLTVVSLAVCLGTVYLVVGLGAGLARLAPVLLGPTAAERVAALEVTAAALAERNRLARELHDSVGHTLTVTTLQAAAARTVLDRDPEFARQALVTIEEAGRAAMADLDHVIGLLRAADDAPRPRGPQPTLSDLERLTADSRAAGLEVSVALAGAVDAVPPAVSREGYRVVQEALTNALRHGTSGRATVRVVATADVLELDVRNAIPPVSAAGSTSTVSGEAASVTSSDVTTGGRGLAGMRERVQLLRGSLHAGRDGEEWAVSARLPFADTAGRTS